MFSVRKSERYIYLNRKVVNYIRIQKIFTNLAVLFLRGNIKQSEMQAIKKGLIWNYLDLPCGIIHKLQ